MNAITRHLPMLDSPEAKRVVRHLESRKKRLKWIPGVVGPAVFIGWMVVFGVGTDLLEDTKWDIINRLTARGAMGFAILFALGPALGIAAATVSASALRVFLIKRELRSCLETPICVWCDYKLTGLDPHDSRIRCPECGKMSPVSLRR